MIVDSGSEVTHLRANGRHTNWPGPSLRHLR
jgi:hypothetical protein